MNGALPFDGFLDILRSKGYGVGLHEYFALGNLLARWDRTQSEEFGDALAALVGRSDDEVQSIRRLFGELYLRPPVRPAEPEPEPDRVILRRWVWMVGAVAAVAILAVVLALPRGRSPTPEAPRRAQPTEPPPSVPSPSLAPLAPVTFPTPSPPVLPDPPARLVRSVAVSVVSIAFLGVLSIFWALKIRETTERWVRETWSAALAALPGPFHFSVVVRQGGSPLPRTDVEDSATILGRAFTPDSQARQLDVLRTIHATLRRGLLPQLVFKARRTAQTILVFEDVCQDMAMWRSKVNALLSDLGRQGIRLERWYVDGDFRVAADLPHRTPLRFETIVRRQPQSPILIISTGSTIESLLATPDKTWVMVLRDATRRSWLTPVSDMRLWPEAFDALPLDVWPMTRDGLARAAKELAGVEGESLPIVSRRGWP